MATEIVNLDELLPDDVVVKYQGVDYRLPGDVDTETVFKLMDQFKALTSIDGEDADTVFAEMRTRVSDIHAELLALFQVRQPQLTELKLGLRATGALLKVILGRYGVQITDTGNPTQPAPKKTPRKPAVRKK